MIVDLGNGWTVRNEDGRGIRCTPVLEYQDESGEATYVLQKSGDIRCTGTFVAETEE